VHDHDSIQEEFFIDVTLLTTGEKIHTWNAWTCSQSHLLHSLFSYFTWSNTLHSLKSIK